MSLLNDLTKQLSGGNLAQMSQLLGSDEKKTGAAVSAALPLLMGALAKNSSRGNGAEDLNRALEDHDGSVLDDVGSFLGQADKGPGDGILGHLLGQRRGAAEQSLSRASGMDKQSSGKLLAMLAPLVMAQLGKQKRQTGLDANGLAGLLGQERSNVEKQVGGKGMGLVESLLDSDGDGDVDLSDIVKGGGGLLGKLFGSR